MKTLFDSVFLNLMLTYLNNSAVAIAAGNTGEHCPLWRNFQPMTSRKYREYLYCPLTRVIKGRHSCECHFHKLNPLKPFVATSLGIETILNKFATNKLRFKIFQDLCLHQQKSEVQKNVEYLLRFKKSTSVPFPFTLLQVFWAFVARLKGI